jgi:3-isopropylmalate dehydrogenase
VTSFNVALLAGDCIGPEVTGEAVRVLEAVGRKFGHSFVFKEAPAGGAAWDRFGEHLPASTLATCEAADAILKGPVGGPTTEMNDPKWRGVETNVILPLRKHFDLFLNLRPIIVPDSLLDLSPIRPEVVRGTDLLILRELTGGIYFGERGERQVEGPHERLEREVFDTESYKEHEIERAARAAFRLAEGRRRKVTLVAKSNVMQSGIFWREVVDPIAREHPEVAYDYLHVDNASMQLIQNPRQFDVLLTSNLFGDILSDEASVLPGSIGLAPSASLNEAGFGLFEPIHGSAPDIAGQGKANPVATILSAAMMLRISFDLPEAAAAVEASVRRALDGGARTADIARGGETPLSTEAMGRLIVDGL